MPPQRTTSSVTYRQLTISSVCLVEYVYYSFPKNERKRKAWCKAINIPEACLTTRSTLCSLHFRVQDLYGSPEIRRYVKEYAIPFLVKPTSTSCKEQCTKNLEAYDDEPVKIHKKTKGSAIIIDTNQMEIGRDIDITQLNLLKKTAAENMDEKINLTCKYFLHIICNRKIFLATFCNIHTNMHRDIYNAFPSDLIL
ncbi:uncharacterized protein LOC113562009 [Ooceraea biroi]|uniref:uncharacterized protein LOC113562009 n=1 Tax=Ooceraea biroi TaxID=2015173 RepID=UPI000F095145|nr:uncharacterized protein LOC113562009 [Ooceraea biroi]